MWSEGSEPAVGECAWWFLKKRGFGLKQGAGQNMDVLFLMGFMTFKVDSSLTRTILMKET